MGNGCTLSSLILWPSRRTSETVKWPSRLEKDVPNTDYMGVEPKTRGNTPKWMVKIMGKPYKRWDDLGGFPPIFGETPISNLGHAQ